VDRAGTIEDVRQTGIRCDEGNLFMFPGEWASASSQAPFWYWKEQTRRNVCKVTDCCLEIGDRFWDAVTKEQKSVICDALEKSVKDGGNLHRSAMGKYTLVIEYTNLTRLGVKLGNWF
jgi:hypothetical protein